MTTFSAIRFASAIHATHAAVTVTIYNTLLFMTALTVITIVAQIKSRDRGEAPPPLHAWLAMQRRISKGGVFDIDNWR